MKATGNKDIKYIVIEDKNNLFGVGTELSANDLIQDYISGLNMDDENDKETIYSLTEYTEKGMQYLAVTYIANVWEFAVQEAK